jgi:hypothetical protein
MLIFGGSKFNDDKKLSINSTQLVVNFNEKIREPLIERILEHRDQGHDEFRLVTTETLLDITKSDRLNDVFKTYGNNVRIYIEGLEQIVLETIYTMKFVSPPVVLFGRNVNRGIEWEDHANFLRNNFVNKFLNDTFEYYEPKSQRGRSTQYTYTEPPPPFQSESASKTRGEDTGAYTNNNKKKTDTITCRHNKINSADIEDWMLGVKKALEHGKTPIIPIYDKNPICNGDNVHPKVALKIHPDKNIGACNRAATDKFQKVGQICSSIEGNKRGGGKSRKNKKRSGGKSRKNKKRSGGKSRKNKKRSGGKSRKN